MAKYISQFDDPTLTGEDIISLMYDNTNHNGKLYIPDYSGTAASYGLQDIALVMNWGTTDFSDEILETYKDILKAIKTVLPLAESFEEFEQNYEDIFEKWSDEWGVYPRHLSDFLAPFEYEPYDGFEFGKLPKDIKPPKNLDEGREYAGYFDDGTDDYPREPEWSDYENGIEMLIPDIAGNEAVQWINNGEYSTQMNCFPQQKNQAKCRIRFGIGLSSTDVQVIIYSRILLKHMFDKKNGNASDEQILQAERNLATVLTILLCAEKMDLVDAAYRNDVEDFENLTDEEQDEHFAKIKRKNIGKPSSVSPAFCLAILQDCSSFDHPMTKREVFEEAEKRYSEIPAMRTIERNLVNLSITPGMGVNYVEGKGYWYEKPVKNV